MVKGQLPPCFSSLVSTIQLSCNSLFLLTFLPISRNSRRWSKLDVILHALGRRSGTERREGISWKNYAEMPGTCFGSFRIRQSVPATLRLTDFQ